MSRALVIVEDSRWRDLRPLTDVLPVPALAFGAATLWERWRRAAAVPLLAIEARAGVMRVWRDAPKPDATRLGARDPVLVVNSAALPGPWLEAEAEGSSKLLVAGGRFVAARLDFEAVAPGLGTGAEFELIVAENSLFGPTITTAGLLVGRDIMSALSDRHDLDIALIPAETINEDRVFLDDYTLEAVRESLPMPIFPSYDFIDVLQSEVSGVLA